MPKLVESWWDLNDDGRTVVANNRLKCQSNGEINPNKVYSRSTLPKATPTTNKSSTDYNTIDIIAIYNIPSTRLRKKIKRYLEITFKPEKPDSKAVLETSPCACAVTESRKTSIDATISQ